MSKRKVSANEKHLEKLNLKLAQRNNKLELEMQELKKDTFKEYQRMVIAEKNVALYEQFMTDVLNITDPLKTVKRELTTRKTLSNLLMNKSYIDTDGVPYTPITDDNVEKMSSNISGNSAFAETIHQINSIFGMFK